MTDQWTLDGTYMEACTCETPCPCTMHALVHLGAGAALERGLVGATPVNAAQRVVAERARHVHQMQLGLVLAGQVERPIKGSPGRVGEVGGVQDFLKVEHGLSGWV